jgi:hypothetical protein
MFLSLSPHPQPCPYFILLYWNKSLLKLKKKNSEPSAVAHVCNLSYSGGGDQEDRSSRPNWARCS